MWCGYVGEKVFNANLRQRGVLWMRKSGCVICDWNVCAHGLASATSKTFLGFGLLASCMFLQWVSKASGFIGSQAPVPCVVCVSMPHSGSRDVGM